RPVTPKALNTIAWGFPTVCVGKPQDGVTVVFPTLKGVAQRKKCRRSRTTFGQPPEGTSCASDAAWCATPFTVETFPIESRGIPTEYASGSARLSCITAIAVIGSHGTPLPPRLRAPGLQWLLAKFLESLFLSASSRRPDSRMHPRAPPERGARRSGGPAVDL